MPKADLGEKQLCPSCAAKFYDLNKRPAVCPKCKTAFDPGDETVKLKRVKAVRSTAATYEDEEEKPLVDAEDGVEEEVEETKELDAEGEATPVLTEDGEEEEAVSPDSLPEGFSEEEADLEEDVADADAPMLDLDDDEEFSDDDLEIGADDEEEPR